MVPPSLLESRAEIADLVHRYAFNVRHRVKAAAADLFCPDVEFIIREFKVSEKGAPTVRSHLVGLPATLEYIHQSSDKMVLCPLIHNLLIEVDGHRAHSTCIMENRTWPAIPNLIGEYEDTFAFEERWRFARRIYTMFVD